MENFEEEEGGRERLKKTATVLVLDTDSYGNIV
jgi:hypothetical protein